jgi:hypothetical protein
MKIWANISAPKAAVDYKTLYRDNLQLQNQLIALKKAVSTNNKKPSSTPILSALFPNLGIFQPNAGNGPTTYAAPTLPMYPGQLLFIFNPNTNEKYSGFSLYKQLEN